jgi:hypothetical protein
MTYPEREGTTMSEMQSAAQTYALGHTAEAFQRLLVQGQLFHPFTRRLLEEADLRAGMHVPEPAALLRQLATRLRPGGVLAFQEHDIPSQSDATLPASPLWEQAVTWCTQAFQRAGVESRMGMKLSGTFLEACLPAPKLRYEAVIGAGPGWAGCEVLAGVVRELLPLLLRFGIANAEDIRIETLAARLREEVASTGGVARLPALVSAWTRIGES